MSNENKTRQPRTQRCKLGKPGRKPSSKSNLMKLTQAQRERIITWLFTENLSYRKVEDLTEKEFGRRINHDALGIFYSKVMKERNLARVFTCAEHARAILKGFGKNSDEVYEALLRVLAQIAFETTVNTREGEKPDLGPLMDALPLLMDARKDAREGKKLALEHERWEFDVVRMCHEHFKELQAIIANPSLDEPSRLEAIRRRLFGKNLAEGEQGAGGV